MMEAADIDALLAAGIDPTEALPICRCPLPSACYTGADGVHHHCRMCPLCTVDDREAMDALERAFPQRSEQ